MVGDVLSGTGILLLGSDGGLACLRPQRHAHRDAGAGVPREGTPVSSTPQSASTAALRHQVQDGKPVLTHARALGSA